MKKLPLGKSDFKDIIQNNFVYVDKTKYIYDLIESGDVFFLSRPRRFGKSLTVSTLYYLFKGEKELFEDTWIYDKWNWEEWPIIRLDMSRLNGETVEANRFRLTLMLKEIAETYGVELEYSKPELYDVMIDELIKKLVRKYKKEVVVLVDEYDYPMLSNITDEEELEREREFLSKFYMMFKTNDENIRFVFITGISKFSKVSIFSKMNNLIDLTMNEEYSTMFGYVEEEIERYYREHIEVVKERLNMSEEGFWEKIREWYNGYSWDGKNRVYNPHSVNSLFFNKQFLNFWYDTGTPSFLINHIRKRGFVELENMKYSITQLGAREIEDSLLPIFLWQAGYLTIVYKDEETVVFDYPNREVEQSFSELLTTEYTGIDEIVELRDNLRKYFKDNEWKEFIEELNRVISSYPYTLLKEFKKEAHWHVLVRAILATGFGRVKAEELTSKGRADLVVEYDNKVLVMELKLDKSAKEAVEQIKEKGYANKYRGKEVWIMGMNIDSRQRKIVEYLVEKG